MTLIWKLLRQHISVPQFIGFALADLFGVLIILLGYQFYCDVMPLFTSHDSFMKADYLIISKKIGVAGGLSGRANTFSPDEQTELSSRPFVRKAGRFTSAEYKVDADMGINGKPVLSSELFFESVPDEFIDVPLDDWKYEKGAREVPVILPRTYINMYNFGFAGQRSLPKISDGLVGMIDFRIFIHGNGLRDEFKGKVIGFSGRLNTILVPQSFMDWSNARYASSPVSEPTRMLVEVGNPADENVAAYLEDNGYEVDDDKLQGEKTAWFLRMLVIIVMSVGVIISLLSFYILMLSIYLLVQKNAYKLQNLLLIGYSPLKVSSPYILLTVGLNALVLVVAIVTTLLVRGSYMDIIVTLFPDMPEVAVLPMVLLGVGLFVLVSCVNVFAVHNKVKSLWHD
ncbi:MAG: ABC transporter permease [Prevotella sp.]